ncbi:MAG: HNH endonuclease [Rhodomicrobiaceae bacterium]
MQLQKGMNFGVQLAYSIVLMSTHKNAPYNDVMLEDGSIVYEGHDALKSDKYDKKKIDQPLKNLSGSLTENGKFFKAAQDYKLGNREASRVKVYRKIKSGIWVDMGLYLLVDSYIDVENERDVCKFLLKPSTLASKEEDTDIDLLHDRYIPGEVQKRVYERDNGKCRICGATENLHFDHIIPFSKGGSSKTEENIQLLCAKHNLKKGTKFQ